jgi:hypothetical protein
LARRLRIEATFRTKLITTAGTTLVGGARVSRVALGPTDAADQEFLFASLDGLHELSPEIRGVLGQPFLARFDYTLDFQGRRLLFGEPAGAGTRVPFRLVHNRMVVATSQGNLVFDSGASTLFLFRASAGNSGTIRSGDGLTASVSVDKAPELRIGGLVLHPDKAAFDAREAADYDGLLPASLIHAVSISNSEGFLAIRPGTR